MKEPQPDAMELPPSGTQHRQGELYVSQTGFIFSLNGGGALFEVVTPDEGEWTNEAKANAAHLVECWNGWEQMQTMRAVLKAIVNSDMAQREEDEGRVSELLESARAALALKP